MATWDRAPPRLIRAESVLASPATLVFHEDLSRGGTLHQWRVDHYPRLLKQAYRGHRTAPIVTTWIVDGVRCADLAEAVHLLNGPVIAEDVYEVGAP